MADRCYGLLWTNEMTQLSCMAAMLCLHRVDILDSANIGRVDILLESLLRQWSLDAYL